LHQLERAEPPGAHDDFFLTQRVRQDAEERGRAAAHSIPAAGQTTGPDGRALRVVGHAYFAATTRMFDFATTLLPKRISIGYVPRALMPSFISIL